MKSIGSGGSGRIAQSFVAFTAALTLVSCGGSPGPRGDEFAGTAAADQLCHPAHTEKYCILELKDKTGIALPAGEPIAANDQGDVLFVPIDRSGDAFLWSAGAALLLPADFNATGINNSVRVSGAVLGAGGTYKAALWQDRGVTLLPSPNGNSIANALNDTGQLVGAEEYFLGFDANLRRNIFIPRAQIWDSPDAAPRLLEGRYQTPCDGTQALAINGAGQAAGWYTSGDAGGHDDGCNHYTLVEQAVAWAPDASKAVLETADPAYGRRTGSFISDSGKILVETQGTNPSPHVVGIPTDTGVLALGPSDHVLLDSKTIRLPDGSMIPMLDAGFIDPAEGWNLADLDTGHAGPQGRPRLGFDRLGRMFGVATRNGQPAAFMLIPTGARLPD